MPISRKKFAVAALCAAPHLRRVALARFKPGYVEPRRRGYRGESHQARSLPDKATAPAAPAWASLNGAAARFSPRRLKNFGGWSGLVLDPDGKKPIAISDVPATWMTVDMTIADGRLRMVPLNARIGPLKGPDGDAPEQEQRPQP